MYSYYIDMNWFCLLCIIKVRDSIEEVYCNVAVELSGNIALHALIESFFSLHQNIEVKFFS